MVDCVYVKHNLLGQKNKHLDKRKDRLIIEVTEQVRSQK